MSEFFNRENLVEYEEPAKIDVPEEQTFAHNFGSIAPLRFGAPAEALQRFDRYVADLEELSAARKVNEKRSASDDKATASRGRTTLTRLASARTIVQKLQAFLSVTHGIRYRTAKVRKEAASMRKLGETCALVDRLRAEETQLMQAPMPVAEHKAILREQIQSWRDRGRPNFQPGYPTLASVHSDGMALFLAWLLPNDVWENAIDRLIGTDERENATATDEKFKRLKEVRKELLEAERLEVALVDASEGAAYYRSTTSELALLGLEIS